MAAKVKKARDNSDLLAEDEGRTGIMDGLYGATQIAARRVASIGYFMQDMDYWFVSIGNAHLDSLLPEKADAISNSPKVLLMAQNGVREARRTAATAQLLVKAAEAVLTEVEAAQGA